MQKSFIRFAAGLLVGATGATFTNISIAQDQQPPAAPDQAPADGPGPDALPDFSLAEIPTVRVRRETLTSPWIVADSSVLPKDRAGIWLLEFAYKPIRMIEVEVEGKRRKVHYLYYRVVNRTGQTRRFIPQFTLISDDGKRHESREMPLAAKKIKTKEDPTKQDILGATAVMGELPASTRDGIDDAAFGVAIWDDIDFKADGYSVFVRGLSDGYQEAAAPDGKIFTRYKALRLDFNRYGDALDPHSSEIRPAEPPFEWVYYP